MALPLRDSLFILSHQAAFVKHFFEIFLKLSKLFTSFFQRLPSLARQLRYNTTRPGICQHLFSRFFKKLAGDSPILYRRVVSLACDPNFVKKFAALQRKFGVLPILGPTDWIKRPKNHTFVFVPTLPSVFSFFSSPVSSWRIHFNIFLSRRDICTWVVCSTLATSLWVRPPKNRRRMSSLS